jgi:hypothetical protein
MSEWLRKGVRRVDLKIIASDCDPAANTKAVDALNERLNWAYLTITTAAFEAIAARLPAGLSRIRAERGS